MEDFEPKKYKKYVVIAMPLIAALSILLFVFLPVKFLNKTLEKEAEEKNKEVEKVIDINLFDWI
jgi:hypothetical protein